MLYIEAYIFLGVKYPLLNTVPVCTAPPVELYRLMLARQLNIVCNKDNTICNTKHNIEHNIKTTSNTTVDTKLTKDPH